MKNNNEFKGKMQNSIMLNKSTRIKVLYSIFCRIFVIFMESESSISNNFFLQFSNRRETAIIGIASKSPTIRKTYRWSKTAMVSPTIDARISKYGKIKPK